SSRCVAESREQITDTSYPQSWRGSIRSSPAPLLILSRRDSIHFATFAEKGRHIKILLLEIGDHGVSHRVNRDHISGSGFGCSLLHYHPRRCGFRLCFRLEKIPGPCKPAPAFLLPPATIRAFEASGDYSELDGIFGLVVQHRADNDVAI